MINYVLTTVALSAVLALIVGYAVEFNLGIWRAGALAGLIVLVVMMHAWREHKGEE